VTGRRPIRGHTERVSRALQFIPGHVSGRVASAQPIRRRGGNLRQASIGAVGAVAPPDPPTLPSSVLFNSATASAGDPANGWRTWGGGALTVPDEGDMLVSIACGTRASITMPTGWTSLGSGSSGANRWAAAGCIYDGTQSRDWTLAAGTYPEESGAVATWWLSGAADLEWQAAVSSSTAGSVTSDAFDYICNTTPSWQAPGDWDVRIQALLLCGVIGTPTDDTGLSTIGASSSTLTAQIVIPMATSPTVADITTDDPISGTCPTDEVTRAKYLGGAPTPVAFQIAVGAA
jgi:hypothetical protein